MQKTLKLLRCVLSVATVGIVLLLCLQCLNIYLVGNRPENISDGVYLTPVYSAEAVADRLNEIAPFFVAYAVIAVITIAVQLYAGEPKHSAVKKRRVHTDKSIFVARLAVLVLGILFIVLGVMNGGSRDVLVKAINICTECIGLG